MKHRLRYIIIILLNCCMLHANAQNMIVYGKVTNQNNEALQGVNVSVYGTSTSTTTDTAGKYKILANRNDIIVFCQYGKTIVEKTAQFQINISLFDYQTDPYLKGIFHKADQDDAKAQLQLANYSQNGKFGLEKNFAEAYFWYKKAANTGDSTAKRIIKDYCSLLGNNYLYLEEGVTQDVAMAVKWYREGADNGDNEAQFHLGNCYANGYGVTKDLQKAFEWFETAANNGNILAQNNVGWYYQAGIAVEKNLPKAIEWYEKAASQGFAQAQYNLGYIYARGIGVPTDYELAAQWYQKAALQNHADAQCNLGILYEYGKGVPQDLRKAFDWYVKSAKNGNKNAQFNVGVFYETGKGETTNNPQEAFAWYEQAAKNGHAKAQYRLANCYLQGAGVDFDIDKAREWLEKASAQGNEAATIQLKYLNDIYLNTLENEAVAGNPIAQYRLATCYYFGKGIKKNIAEAIKWFTEAAENGEVNSQAILGDFYYYGFDNIKEDIKQARKWYEKAAQQGSKDAIEQLNRL